ncbi:hypothetical protein ACFY0F_30175 [Streptomyces sp. NPDC001544]|uniref:hypothetical protein n=1 Tax=Streptomyces sp. NPDC001544 TaxID=3364584 RepID=UPI0036A26500
MKRWWKWVGAPVVLGIAAGVVMTLIIDRSWSSELGPRCLMMSVLYMAIAPVVTLSRRRAEQRDQQHFRDIEKARRGRRG